MIQLNITPLTLVAILGGLALIGLLWSRFAIRIKRHWKLVGTAFLATLFIGADCSPTVQQQVLQSDQSLMARQLAQYQAVQPRHFYLYSQDVNMMNAIMDARTKGVTTYSFFFNYGVQDPLYDCPSRSYPMPGDTELTNPDQIVTGGASSSYWGVSVGMIDPNGLYGSHATNSTYAMCIAPNGSLYLPYSEPIVFSVPFASATWDETRHRVVIPPDATPSFNVAYDANSANQPPLDIVTKPDGSVVLRTSDGKETPISGPGGGAATPAPNH